MWLCSVGVPGSLVGVEVTMSSSGNPPGGTPPDPPAPSLRDTFLHSERRVATRVLQPLQSFLHTEAAGGILLLAAAIVALVWANGPFGDSYERFWGTQATIGVEGILEVSNDLHHWVNEGLMTLFFFVVGLEVKRELTTGELRDPKAVALPAAAAIGGMVVPALLYVLIAGTGAAGAGWGIPMATDIAFALGVLTLVGRRAPASLKLFLLTLAIVDDIGAILVIALFYTEQVDLELVVVAIGGIGLMFAADRLHVRAMPVYVGLGIAVWLAVQQAGIEPTLAGVVLGLLAPSRPFQRPRAVSDEARRVAAETDDDPNPPDADAQEWLRLASLSREAVSPLTRLETMLHPWTSYLIVPLFALANAGIPLSLGGIVDASTSGVTLGVFFGLVIGKLVGITLASWLVVRAGLGRMPQGATWRHIGGVAALGGIGFTVSLFIAELAFEGTALLDLAKIGILAASLVAGVAGALLLRGGSKPDVDAPPAAPSTGQSSVGGRPR
ncbi:MAG: Na+/H+ antiporter NhaA [Actinomycetota bacterium]